jgi:hypothetical protein
MSATAQMAPHCTTVRPTPISESAQRSTIIAMRWMRSLRNRSSTWAFLTGLLIVPVIDGLRAAFYPNFTDWHYNYNAFWLCAAFLTFVARWVSRTRAEMRAEAEDAAMYREMKNVEHAAPRGEKGP